MIALIDGDSIAFMLGWHHKDHRHIPDMHQAIDLFLENLFIQTGADMYFGAVGNDIPSFRYDTYKVKPYKGTRKDLDEHMVFWRPVVLEYLQQKWRFSTVDGYEADDIIATAAEELQAEKHEFIICSPDKDLKQIAGLHFDYRTGSFCTVSEHQAVYNAFKLMLEGDEADNVIGIPGFGPKKATEKLKPLLESGAGWGDYAKVVKEAYHRHFCEYYGDLIYEQTMDTLSLAIIMDMSVNIEVVPKKLHPFDSMNEH